MEKKEYFYSNKDKTESQSPLKNQTNTFQDIFRLECAHLPHKKTGEQEFVSLLDLKVKMQIPRLVAEVIRCVDEHGSHQVLSKKFLNINQDTLQ